VGGPQKQPYSHQQMENEVSNGSDVLSRLTKKINKESKPTLVLHSLPGLGKTSLASCFPKPLFIGDSRDRGFADLVRSGQVNVELDPIEAADWRSLMEVTKALADPETPLECETVVFENLGGFQLHLADHLIAQEVAKTGKDRGMITEKFHAWGGQGFRGGVSDFSDWFRTACSIAERTNTEGKSVRVIFCGHSALVKDRNVTGLPGEEFHRVDIDLHHEFLKVVHRDASAIAWMRQRPLVVKSETGGVGKALSDDIREIVLHASAQATAKNRWGIVDPVSMGVSAKHAYTNLVNAIVAAKKRTQTGEGK